MGISLCDPADKIADIPLLDFMDALCPPIGNDVPAEQVRYALAGAGLRNMISNECLDQIFNLVDDEFSARVLLLLGRVSPIEFAANIFCAWARAIGSVMRP